MKNLSKLVCLAMTLLCLASLMSCKSSKGFSPFVFRADGGMYHTNLIFQTNPYTYIEHSSAIQSNILGFWTIKGDTIVCTPKYEYRKSNGDLLIIPLNSQDSTVATVTKTYIYKDDKLTDYTDYSPILNFNGLSLYDPNEEKTVFYRLKLTPRFNNEVQIISF